MQTPQWYLVYLLRMMERLQAREMLDRLTASSYPHMKQADYTFVYRTYQALANPDPPRKPERKPVIEYNPEKAAQYFRAMGVTVVQKGARN